MEVRKITIAIPTFNRSEMTIESFYDVYNDERVGEVVIVDDASDLDIYEDLKSMCDALPKVKLYRNLTNQDCYRNKMTAISYATNEWCILLDSDNKIDKSYIDAIFAHDWYKNVIFTPSFAMPNFNFQEYSCLQVAKKNVSEYIDKPMFETMLNACNFFVNKFEYICSWDGNVDPVTSDSIFFAYCWLRDGNMINVVPNLTYQHKVHEGSHYQNNVHRTAPGFHESILNKLRQLT